MCVYLFINYMLLYTTVILFINYSYSSVVFKVKNKIEEFSILLMDSFAYPNLEAT